MSFSSKREISKNQKEKDNLQSVGDTFFDSLHYSKINENTKNNFFQPNNKENKFYLALNCMLGPDTDTFILVTSEFSENNPIQNREENISRYLHHPINAMRSLCSKLLFITISRHVSSRFLPNKAV